VPKFYDQFESLGRDKDYFLDTLFSMFFDAGTLNVASFTVVSAAEAEDYYKMKWAELKQIESFGKNTISYVVRKNDSLWRISNSYYQVGQLMYALADYNGISTTAMTIYPGQVISVPPIYLLGQFNKYFVLPGSSLWEHWKHNCPEIPWDSYKKVKIIGTEMLNRVEPLQVTKGCEVSLSAP
jgi:hypothetical protein